MKFEVAERRAGRPSRVRVTKPDARAGGPSHDVSERLLGEVAIGDAFRRRRGRYWMRATVTAFTSDGQHAYVDRNTSRRKQSVKTERLLASPWERSPA